MPSISTANVCDMRTIWQGTLELAEIAIPVGIVPTVRDAGEKLKRLHEACKTPVSLRSYCTLEEQLLETDDVVSAWEVAPGEYLVLDADELAALKPEDTRRIPIGCFFHVDELDPVFVRNRYWLAPSKSTIAHRAYAVFAEAMHDLDAAALTRFTWKGEKVGAVYSPDGKLLELLVLHFAEDVLTVEAADELAALAVSAQPEVALAKKLIGRHTRNLDVDDDLASLERPLIRELLEAKLAGQPIVRPEPVEREPGAVGAGGDLTAALERSLKQAPRARRRPARAAG